MKQPAGDPDRYRPSGLVVPSTPLTIGVLFHSCRALERTHLGSYATVTHLIAGGLGGGMTAALSTPFDTVKVRMQTKVYATKECPFPSMLDVVSVAVWGISHFPFTLTPYSETGVLHRRGLLFVTAGHVVYGVV